MNTKLLTKLASSKIGRKAIKNAPGLCLGGGLLCVGGALALTVRATLKTQDALDERNDKISDIEDDPELTDEEAAKAIQKVNVTTGVKIIKNVTPPFACAAAGVFLLTKGHNIQAKRIATVSTALTATNEMFSQYRKNVVEDLGSEKDAEYLGRKFEDVTMPTDETDKKGRPKTTNVKVPKGPSGYSPYAVCFDDGCDSYINGSAIYNINFLKGAQETLNNKLQTDGFLLLKDFYNIIGYTVNPGDPLFNASITMGWWYTEDHRSHVDFGLFDLTNDKYGIKKDFLSGYKVNVYLEPNIDGYIVDRF